MMAAGNSGRCVMAAVKRTSILERLIALVIGAAIIAGFALIAQGFYIKAKAAVAQTLLERAWSRTLAGQTAAKPWPWADTWPVAKVAVKRLKEQAIVLQGSSGEAMAFGPGHVQGTPLPGHRGTSVIAAHRDTHFAFLEHVKTGDIVEVTTRDGQHRRFAVDRLQIVDASQSGIEPQSPHNGLALVTCWPFGVRQRGPLRYVVHASLIEPKRVTRSKLVQSAGANSVAIRSGAPTSRTVLSQENSSRRARPISMSSWVYPSWQSRRVERS